MKKTICAVIVSMFAIMGCEQRRQVESVDDAAARCIASYVKGNKQESFDLMRKIVMFPDSSWENIRCEFFAFKIGSFLVQNGEYDSAEFAFARCFNSQNAQLKFGSLISTGLMYENGLTTGCRNNGRDWSLKNALNVYKTAQRVSNNADPYVRRVENKLSGNNQSGYGGSSGSIQDLDEFKRSVDQGLQGILGDQLYGEVFGGAR